MAVGLAASAVAHALALALLWGEIDAGLGGAAGEPDDAEEVIVDVQLAPEAPEAFEPEMAEAEPEPEPEPEPVEPEPEPEPEPDEAAALVTDEVPDAGVAAAGTPDAGVDAGALANAAVADAGVDAGAVASAARDAGVAADGGALAATPRDGGALAATPRDAGTAAGTAPAWSRLVHADHVPPGDHIAVLIRFDRLRGTEWAERVAAVLAPMPDYRSIIGGRDVALADLFDLLWITSSDPRQVTATNLAAKTTLPAARLQTFLDHRHARVSWSPVRGGTLGARQPSRSIVPGDPRVYLALAPHWVLLAAPSALGALVEPATGAPAAPPTWVERLPALEAATDEADELAVLVSATGLPARLVIPRIGSLPAPEAAIAALDIDPQGFLLRGTLTFASPEAAATFERELSRIRGELLGSWSGRAILASLSAHNALEQLTMRRRGRALAISTSLSIADARAVMRLAGDWTARFFDPAARR